MRRRRRTAKEIKMDNYRGMGKLEVEKETKEADEAFKRKPYQNINVSKYVAKKYKIGDDADGE